MNEQSERTPEQQREGYAYVIAASVFFLLLWSRKVETFSELFLWTLIAWLVSRFFITSYNARLKRKQSSDLRESGHLKF